MKVKLIDAALNPIYRYPKTAIAIGIFMTVFSASVAYLLKFGYLGTWDPMVAVSLVFLSFFSIGITAFAIDGMDLKRGEPED